MDITFTALFLGKPQPDHVKACKRCTYQRETGTRQAVLSDFFYGIAITREYYKDKIYPRRIPSLISFKKGKIFTYGWFIPRSYIEWKFEKYWYQFKAR